MSSYQYAEQPHHCPNGKAPVAIASLGQYHHVVRVGINGPGQLYGFIRPGLGVISFGELAENAQEIAGQTINAIYYNGNTGVLHVQIEGGNPLNWSGLTVTLPGGQNYTCSYDAASGSFVWPGLGDKEFTMSGISITIGLVAVV